MDFINLPDINNCSVAVIGLGYVGLPLAYTIATQNLSLPKNAKCNRKVLGYDLDKKRIQELNRGFDKNNMFTKDSKEILKSIFFTNEKNLLNDIEVFIITVPTPLKEKNEPELSFIKEASKTIGKAIKSNKNKEINQIVIYESTVYPGVTEDICIPIVEAESGKKYNSEEYKNSFYCGYSPERINPGDTDKTIDSIIKVTSGSNKKISLWVDKFYKSFISAGTFNVSNIKVAESAKIIENTQRDINIALVNELSILFKKMDIDTNEVLNAADTKWNFQKFRPGLVGGHCIGVDPYYLTFKAKEIGFNTNLILAGRKINDNMHQYLLEQICNKINSRKPKIDKEKVLILGFTYKANCSDIRNSQMISLVKNMKKLKMEITVVDPLIESEDVFNKTGLYTLKNIPKDTKYTLVILALAHKEFENINNEKIKDFIYPNSIIFDLTNNLNGDNIFHL